MTDETKTLQQAVVNAEGKLAALLEKSAACSDEYTRANGAIPTATADEIDALVAKRSAANERYQAVQAALPSARAELAAARSAYAESLAPELAWEIARLRAGLVEASVQSVGRMLPAARALVERATELEGLETASKPAPELLTVHGALTAAFNEAVTGAGDGLVSCVVTRGLLLSGDAPAPLVAGRQYREGETLRLPEAVAARFVREGHVARVDAGVAS